MTSRVAVVSATHDASAVPRDAVHHEFHRLKVIVLFSRTRVLPGPFLNNNPLGMSNGLVTALRFLPLNVSTRSNPLEPLFPVPIPPVVASDPKDITFALLSEAVAISGRSFSIPGESR